MTIVDDEPVTTLVRCSVCLHSFQVVARPLQRFDIWFCVDCQIDSVNCNENLEDKNGNHNH